MGDAKSYGILRPDLAAVRFRSFYFTGHVADHRFRAGIHMQLSVNVFEMTAHGINAELELVGNGLVGIAPGEQQQNLLLAQRKPGRFIGNLGFPTEGFDNASGNLAGHGRATGENVQQSRAQIGRFGPFLANNRPHQLREP